MNVVVVVVHSNMGSVNHCSEMIFQIPDKRSVSHCSPNCSVHMHVEKISCKSRYCWLNEKWFCGREKLTFNEI
jgi:hypothetical protein